MEQYRLEEDIKVMCLPADSFPDGIGAAHHILHAIVPTQDRRFFGISFPKKGKGIIYMAAAEIKDEREALSLELEVFVIRKGNYVTRVIYDYFKQPETIGQVFQELLQAPVLDPHGACVEWYMGSRDVRCMVRTG